MAVAAVAIAVGVVMTSRRGDKPAAVAVIAHVHGLGVNPADGRLHVATHTGVFRSAGGRVERVGTSAQDTMGFTVVGPDHFLGSGHPDAARFRRGSPSRLGLMESVDAGTTWTSRSLAGQVDFHLLTAGHGTVYGVDAGTNRLLASTDTTTWDTRSIISVTGLAVDPASVDHLVGAASDGILTSRDGGRTWQPVTDAPGLVALSWAPEGSLWGVDGTGGAHRSTDGGVTWEAAGRVDGQPQAFLATDDGLFAATADVDGRTTIHQSLDAGRTWQVHYQPPA